MCNSVNRVSWKLSFYTSFFICSSFRKRVGVSTGTVSRAQSREHVCISAFNVVPSIVCYSIASLCCFSFTLLSPALSSLSGALLSPFHLARECNGHVVDYTVWSASITGSLLRSRRKRSYQISCRDLSFFFSGAADEGFPRKQRKVQMEEKIETTSCGMIDAGILWTKATCSAPLSVITSAPRSVPEC